MYLICCSSGRIITPRDEKSARTTLWEYLPGIIGYRRDVVNGLIYRHPLSWDNLQATSIVLRC